MTKPRGQESIEKALAERGLEFEKLEAVVLEVDLLAAGVPMPSGNIYPLKLLEAAVEEMQAPIKDRRVIGSFDPVAHSAQVKLDNATHMIESLTLNEEGVLSASLRLLPTEKGMGLLRFLQAGGEIRAAPRGFGSVGDDNVVTDYSILTVDIHSVNGPVVTEAFKEIDEREAQEYPEPEDDA